jgi:hypothetical protein
MGGAREEDMAQSPYLQTLEKLVASAPDAATAAAHKTEIAAYWARMGDFERAEGLIADVRGRFGDGSYARVSIGVMCAEAQLIYFKELGDQARDRMSRAQLLSVAGRDGDLSALTSAWLAHICFNQHRYLEMSRALRTCLDTVGPGNQQAACRLALTLGDAFYAAEDRESGSTWYTKAHGYAVSMGDHSAFAALTYNRAALGAFVARIRVLDSAISPADMDLLDGEVRSANNYQNVAGLASFRQQLENATVAIHLLRGQYADALVRIEALLSDSANISPSDASTVLQCDRCMALALTGRLERARTELIRLADGIDLERCTPDDQVVALSSLERASRSLGEHDRQEDLSRRLQVARSSYRELLGELRSSLSQAVGPGALDRI